MGKNAEVYKELDPIIKENPEISYRDLSADYPELAERIGSWSFNRQKNKITGGSGYGLSKRGNNNSMKDEKIDSDENGKIRDKIIEITEEQKELFLKTTYKYPKRMQEYKKILEVLVKKPDVIFKDIKNPDISESSFVRFKKEFLIWFGYEKDKNLNKKKLKTKKAEKKDDVVNDSAIYLTVFSEMVTEENQRGIELLSRFIEKVRENGGCNWRLCEVIDHETQKRMIEVREKAH